MDAKANWNYPTTVRFGAGRISELPEALRAAGISRPMLVTDAGLARRKARKPGRPLGLGRMEVLRAALDRASMVVLVTLTSLASLIPLAVGTSTQDIFGAIALATAGGTIFGTLGAMFVVPAMLLGRQKRGRSPMDVRGDFGLETI